MLIGAMVNIITRNGGMKGIKGHVDEGGVKTPFFIKWKGKIEEGKAIDQIAGGIDLLPTLVELAGIDHKAKKPLDGENLKSLLITGFVGIAYWFIYLKKKRRLL